MSPAEARVVDPAENQRQRTRLPVVRPTRDPQKIASVVQARGEVGRSLLKALDRFDEAVTDGTPNDVYRLALAVGILSDKLVFLDVRSCARPADIDPELLDAYRAQQQALDEEIARRRAELLRAGKAETIDVTPALLDHLEPPEPDPEG